MNRKIIGIFGLCTVLCQVTSSSERHLALMPSKAYQPRMHNDREYALGNGFQQGGRPVERNPNMYEEDNDPDIQEMNKITAKINADARFREAQANLQKGINNKEKQNVKAHKIFNERVDATTDTLNKVPVFVEAGTTATNSVWGVVSSLWTGITEYVSTPIQEEKKDPVHDLSEMLEQGIKEGSIDGDIYSESNQRSFKESSERLAFGFAYHEASTSFPKYVSSDNSGSVSKRDYYTKEKFFGGK